MKTTLNLILSKMKQGPWPGGGKQKTRAKKTLNRLAWLLFRARAPLADAQNPQGLDLTPEDWELLARLGLTQGNRLVFQKAGGGKYARLHPGWPGLAGRGLIYVKASLRCGRLELELTDAGRVALLLKGQPRPGSGGFA